ncbi:hypothetical protein [uncultured Desulfuromusa sp.]|uniref:hypothetical protein n=1 Tax=uncultured Desulfuromusa sp. TaxID=219183 RepID=UPI002AA67E42|nr:hypothetical protein [uncultured Desulfuromusa sp.]
MSFIERSWYHLSPETTALMGICIIFGIIFGMMIVIVTRLLMQPRSQQKTTKIRLLSPRRHRKQSEKRAADIALARVAGLAVEGPTRR